MRIISGETSLIGVIGSPVKHSLSPVIHNAALQAMDLNWCYIAIPCETQALESVIPALREINFKGLNITIPHKQKSIKYCKEISLAAQQIGAINTLIPNKKGGWNGDNTDLIGFLEPLKKKSWNNKKAILLGCGGSAKAVLAGLKTLNFKEIIVIGRQIDKVNSFVNHISKRYNNFNNLNSFIKGIVEEDNSVVEHIKSADLIVNATPVGMSEKTKKDYQSNKMPLGEKSWQNLNTLTTFYDLIYTPRPTAWLKNAKKQGCESIDGLEMLIQQGAASLKLWSDFKEIPIEIMREAAKSHLKY